MGCDIHLYLEFRPKKSDFWSSMGKISLDRDYDMFSLLAQVRGENERGFEARGLPDELGFHARNDYWLFISESDGERYVTMADAQRWVDSGDSTFINDKEGKPTWVTDPDSHTHSWLNLSEFRKVIEIFNEEHPEWFNADYEAVLAAMEALEKRDMEARIVFWFDN